MTRNTWIGAGITLLLSALAYALFLRHGVAPAVVGYNLVPSERVLYGQVPYRDFIYNYTPGVLWLNAILFKLLGTTLMTARLGVYLAKLATALILYLFGRRYLPASLALLPILMTLCWVGYGDILKVFPTQYGMAFLLAAWLLLGKSERIPGSNQDTASARTRLPMFIAAGACSGAVLVFKHNVGLFACVAIALAAAVLARSHTKPASNQPGNSKLPKLSGPLSLLGGIALVVIPAALYLAARSALFPMIDHFRRHAVAYEEAKGIALPPPTALAASAAATLVVAIIAFIFLRRAPRLFPGLTVILAALLLIVIAVGDRGFSGPLYRSLAAQVYYLPIYAVVAGGALVAAEYWRRNRARAAGLLALVLVAAAAFIEVFPRSDPDHLVRVLPPSLLLICVLLYELGGILTPGARRSSSGSPAPAGAPVSQPWFQPLLVIAAALVISAIGLRVTWAPQFDGGLRMIEDSPLEFERARGVCGSELEAGRFNQIVEYVQQHTSPGDPIFTTARKMTAVYFFAARPNTTPMLWFDSAGIGSEARDRVFQAIEDRTYKLILIGGSADPDTDRSPNIESYERRVASLLAQSYHKTTTIAGITIFEPNQP